MKARFYPVVLSLACGLAAGSAVLAAEATAPTPHAFVDPADPAVAEIRMIGERALDHSGSALVVEVRRVMADHTAALAIGKLHLKDYKLPPAQPGKPAVTAIRRTSLQVRNPANAPDAPDLAALEMIQGQLERGDEVSKVLVQRVTLPGQQPEWRVYRPMVTLKQCLDCHGPPATLAPGVADTLKVFYPADQALNFRTGSWRGLIRASIADTPRKP
ncbi:DUF3365 domain-containing protein [Oleiharenicola lentus]|uniref:DUF3365 domain-containing protein n=1 Tax=Oleiharenicola lentus TaxID=2508720 RepID=A0A4Q1C6G1_9BACT|nr:DUF3365 domain-containing protein [Oleiharenicola lentus]RXK54465.1 DUF3365 domain-containing protein [Oleiharenicola lentus]